MRKSHTHTTNQLQQRSILMPPIVWKNPYRHHANGVFEFSGSFNMNFYFKISYITIKNVYSFYVCFCVPLFVFVFCVHLLFMYYFIILFCFCLFAFRLYTVFVLFSVVFSRLDYVLYLLLYRFYYYYILLSVFVLLFCCCLYDEDIFMFYLLEDIFMFCSCLLWFIYIIMF